MDCIGNESAIWGTWVSESGHSSLLCYATSCSDPEGAMRVLSWQFVWCRLFFCKWCMHTHSSNSSRPAWLLFFVHTNETVVERVKDFQQHIAGPAEHLASVKQQLQEHLISISLFWVCAHVCLTCTTAPLKKPLFKSQWFVNFFWVKSPQMRAMTCAWVLGMETRDSTQTQDPWLVLNSAKN